MMVNTTSGIDIYVKTSGIPNKEAYFFVHGWPQYSAEWDAVLDLADQNIFCIAPDMRGFGNSGKPLSGYSAPLIAQDLLDVIEHFNVTSCHLIAHDIGGLPALILAYRMKKLVKSLAMVEAPFLGVQVEGSEDLLNHYWHLKMFQDVDMATLLVGNSLRPFITDFVHKNAKVYGQIEAQVIEQYIEKLEMPGALRASFMHYHAFPESAKAIQQLTQEKLDIPVIGIGSEKVMGEYCGMAAEQVSTRPHGEVIKNCGHWIPEEKPAKLFHTLNAFWQTF